MALQSLNGGCWIPDQYENIISSIQLATAGTLTASTHYAAMVFQVPKSGNIHKICFRTGAVSVNAASRMTVLMETVSTTNGDPTGTGYGGAVAGSGGAAPAANTWYSIALGTDATATKGDVVAATIKIGTFVAADSVVVSGVNSSSSLKTEFPYSDIFSAAWTKNANLLCAIAVEYDDGTYAYIPHTFPVTTITNQSFKSDTATTDEYALSFSVPFPCRLAGCAATIDGDGDYDVCLYAANSATETTHLSVDKDIRTGTIQSWRPFIFATAQTLVASTNYKISIKPTTTTAVVLPIITVDSAAVFNQMNGGSAFCLGTRVDGGAWAADTTTQRPMIGVLLDQFDDGVQTGSMVMSRVRTGF